MTNKTIDTLFIEHLKRYEQGICFLCNEKTDDNSFVHHKCAESYYDDKQKRIKEAWIKAQEEFANRKTIKEMHTSEHD